MPADKDTFEACMDFGSFNWRFNFVDNIARQIKAAQDEVYGYFFKWDGSDYSDYKFIYGAAHATEIAFFFGGSSDIFGGIAFNHLMDTPGRQALSAAMMDYVGNFCYTGNPNSDGLPMWNMWSNADGGPKVLVLDANEATPEIGMITEEITATDVDNAFWGYYGSLVQYGTQDTLFLFRWY
jgi:carboxylesterase type B